MMYYLKKLLLQGSDKDPVLVSKLQRHIRRRFQKIVPKKFLLFPQIPSVYCMSNSVCLEFPKYGSYQYREELYDLENDLKNEFVYDTQRTKDKIVFVVRDCNRYKS